MSGTSISDFQCVCLEVPYSDIENTEREAGFPERRSRVLNIEMWCYELNCDPPPKKKDTLETSGTSECDHIWRDLFIEVIELKLSHECGP